MRGNIVKKVWQTDRQTDRQTEISVLRAAWSQLVISDTVSKFKYATAAPVKPGASKQAL